MTHRQYVALIAMNFTVAGAQTSNAVFHPTALNTMATLLVWGIAVVQAWAWFDEWKD